MRALYLLVRLRVMEVLRVPSAAFFLLGLPLLFLLLVGAVFADGHPFERRQIALVVAPGSEGTPPPPELRALREALGRFDEVRLHDEPSLATALATLRAHALSGIVVPVSPPGSGWRILVGPREELLGRGLAAALPHAVGPVALEIQALPPRGFVHFLVPGLLVFNLFVGGMFGMGYHMARYRQNQLLRKLATTPLPAVVFVGSQVLGRGVLIAVQALLLLVTAALVFRLPLSAAATLWTLGVSLLGLLAFLGIGFALACLIQSEVAIYDVISAVAWPMILLSEVFFPVDELPSPLPLVASALPSTQMVRLLRAVLLYGQTDARALLPGVAIVAGWTVLTFALALSLFRFSDA